MSASVGRVLDIVGKLVAIVEQVHCVASGTANNCGSVCCPPAGATMLPTEATSIAAAVRLSSGGSALVARHPHLGVVLPASRSGPPGP
ncbi:hypothetical protein [Prauserella rugosa]|uniref:hypothetical protein n=1 Tax=Prauserella rugosa TaxID=43354 RepID=UPI0011A4D81A|nr:hypothetical protein [Prauserella rugosa]